MAPHLVVEDIPNQKLSLQRGAEHLTLDTGAQTLSLEHHSFFGLWKKKLTIPFSRIQEISLKGQNKEGQDAPLSLEIKYQDESGASKSTSLSLSVKDLDQRAEIMDLLFRMGRATSQRSGDNFREGEAQLSLDRYLVRECTEDFISLSLLPSTSPESIGGRPVPALEEPADYFSNEAAQRIEAPVPTFNPKRFLGLYRFLSWKPGEKVELLSAIPRKWASQLLYNLAKFGLPALIGLQALVNGTPAESNTAYHVLFAVGVNFSFWYLLFAKFYRYITWSPEKWISKIARGFAGGWLGLYLATVVAFQFLMKPDTMGAAMWTLLASCISLLFGATGLAARRNLNPDYVARKGGEHTLLDWSQGILSSETGMAGLSSIKELVCSLHEEEVDGQRFFYSRLEAVIEDGRRLKLAQTERFLHTKLEPYFILSPMGEELAKALNVPLRSEDNTQPQTQAQPDNVAVVQEQEEVVGVSR